MILSFLLIAACIGAGLFAAECNQCIYHGKEVYPSPDGEHKVTVRISSPDTYSLEMYRIKVTASGGVSRSASESYRGVESWSVEWQDEDTALLVLDGTRDTAVTIDFSGDAPDFEE